AVDLGEVVVQPLYRGRPATHQVDESLEVVGDHPGVLRRVPLGVTGVAGRVERPGEGAVAVVPADVRRLRVPHVDPPLRTGDGAVVGGGVALRAGELRDGEVGGGVLQRVRRVLDDVVPRLVPGLPPTDRVPLRGTAGNRLLHQRERGRGVEVADAERVR